MRLCTSQGTEMEEEPADEGLVAPVRRLATLLIDVRAVDADSDADMRCRLCRHRRRGSDDPDADRLWRRLGLVVAGAAVRS